MNPKKAETDNDFPAKILENCKDSCEPFLKDLFNNITTGIFPEKLELADITPVFKKKDPFKKENFILTVVSKIFERLLQKAGESISISLSL